MFVKGTADFTTTITKALFPYSVQGARKLTIDALTLYAASGQSIAASTPTVDLSTLSSQLSAAAGQATVSFPADDVLNREATQQVFLALQYHFGRA